MTIEATCIAWDAKIPAIKKLVLLYLANMGENFDIVDIKPAKIAEFVGIQESKVQDIVHALIQSGHLHQWSPDGKMTWLQVTTPHQPRRG